MKRLIILVIVCTLINGCGLFKKTTKVEEKQVNKVEVEHNRSESTEGRQNSREESNVSGKSAERTRKDIDSYTSIEADEIEITESGIKAKGNVKYSGNLTDKSENERKSDLTASQKKESDAKYSNNVKEENKGEIKQESKQVEKVSEPSGKGIIVGWIGAAVFVIILLWYLGVKKK